MAFYQLFKYYSKFGYSSVDKGILKQITTPKSNKKELRVDKALSIFVHPRFDDSIRPQCDKRRALFHLSAQNNPIIYLSLTWGTTLPIPFQVNSENLFSNLYLYKTIYLLIIEVNFFVKQYF